jgi:hypothetical protein
MANMNQQQQQNRQLTNTTTTTTTNTANTNTTANKAADTRQAAREEQLRKTNVTNLMRHPFLKF